MNDILNLKQEFAHNQIHNEIRSEDHISTRHVSVLSAMYCLCYVSLYCNIKQ